MIFPEITELEYYEDDFTEDLPPMGKSFLYDFKNGDFVYKNGKLIELHGKEALKSWIEKVIRTERDRFKVYEDTDYGVTIEQYIGTNLPNELIEAELKRETIESLLTHPYIDDIENWKYERGTDYVKLNFTVITPEDAFNQEVNL